MRSQLFVPNFYFCFQGFTFFHESSCDWFISLYFILTNNWVRILKSSRSVLPIQNIFKTFRCWNLDMCNTVFVMTCTRLLFNPITLYIISVYLTKKSCKNSKRFMRSQLFVLNFYFFFKGLLFFSWKFVWLIYITLFHSDNWLIRESLSKNHEKIFRGSRDLQYRFYFLLFSAKLPIFSESLCEWLCVIDSWIHTRTYAKRDIHPK